MRLQRRLYEVYTDDFTKCIQATVRNVYRRLYEMYTDDCTKCIQTTVRSVYRRLYEMYTDDCTKCIHRRLYEVYTDDCTKCIQTTVRSVYRRLYEVYTACLLLFLNLIPYSYIQLYKLVLIGIVIFDELQVVITVSYFMGNPVCKTLFFLTFLPAQPFLQ